MAKASRAVKSVGLPYIWFPRGDVRASWLQWRRALGIKATLGNVGEPHVQNTRDVVLASFRLGRDGHLFAGTDSKCTCSC